MTGIQPDPIGAPEFSKTFAILDQTTKALVSEAMVHAKGSRDVAAKIVVEGVRMHLASLGSPACWTALVRREFERAKIKVNDGDNHAFRVIAAMIFRDLEQVRDDSNLADRRIGRSQLSRYASAMAFAFDSHKAGTPLDDLTQRIVDLGGVRKIADQRAHANRPIESAPSNVVTINPNPVPSGLIGQARLRVIITSPIVCLVHPDGSITRTGLDQSDLDAFLNRRQPSKRAA